VSITVGEFRPAKAVIDARNLESAIYNCCSTPAKLRHAQLHVPEVKVHLAEVDEGFYVDNSRTMVPAYLPSVPEDVVRSIRDRRKNPNGNRAWGSPWLIE